jgi:hypothetical protein
MLAEDGSGKGAGLVSAIAQRINTRNVNNTSNGQQTHVNGNNKMSTTSTNNGKGIKNGHTTNGYSNGLL